MRIDKKTTKRAKPAPPQVATDEVQVLQFKLTLDDFKPRVYRRVQVRSDMTMGQFAHVIMTLFRMEVSHLYAFAFPDYKVERKVAGFPFPLPPQPVRFELFGDFADDEPDGETLFDIADESLTLASVLARFPSKRFTFEYDTGDGWGITILFEKIVPEGKAAPDPLPCVLKGEGYGIVEDCGGVWGLAQLIDLVKRRAAGQPIEDTGYDEPRRLEWLDDLHPEAAEALLAPEAFDVAAANRALHPKPRRRAAKRR